MKDRPSALIVTNMFPPLAAVGVHRTVGLCQRLVEHNWDVTVITARPGRDASLDDALLAALPESIRVVRTAAPDLPAIAAKLLKRRRTYPSAKDDISTADASTPSENDAPRRSRVRQTVDWLSWWLHVPDGCTGWFLPAVWAGMSEGIRNRPDVVFSSAPVWTAHVAAAVIARLLRVPLVADFRDPWCGSAFRKMPYSAHRRIDALLESFVVKTARKITCAWDGIRRHLVERYPQRVADIETVLNGFDPDLIDATPAVRLDLQRCVFLHTGSFYGPRSPVPLLAAAQQLQRDATLAERVLFVLAGLDSYGGRSLDELVCEYGVQDMVRVLRRVSHAEAIGLLKGADAAILFGQSGNDSLASIPAKAYEYIGAGKPVLSIGAGDEVCRVMRDGGCGVWEASAERPTEIAGAVVDVMEVIANSSRDACIDAQARDKFTRAKMAAGLERVMKAAIEK